MVFEEWLEDILTGGAGVPDSADDYALVTVRHVARLFAECGTLLRDYSDRLVGEGWWNLIDGGGAAATLALLDHSVPYAQRQQATLNMTHVFSDCFAVRPGLHPLSDDKENEKEPWRFTCFMWWDIYCGVDRSLKPHRLGGAQLEVMRQTLHLDCRECRLSALHGLGHSAHGGCAATARLIIDEFLAGGLTLDADIVDYARQARTGQIL